MGTLYQAQTVPVQRTMQRGYWLNPAREAQAMRTFREPGTTPPEKPPRMPSFPPIGRPPRDGRKPKPLVLGHWPIKVF